MVRLLFSFLFLAAPACAPQVYSNTKPATFSGAIDVRWIGKDRFLFMPNKDDPFFMVRPDGRLVRPGLMYTDGGSIPQFLWGVDGFSPWGYGPAHIVHDWVFDAKHCGVPPENVYTFEDSVAVMAEGLKALMEGSPEMKNYFAFDAIVTAVASPIARRLWDEGQCRQPTKTKGFALPSDTPPGELLMTIRVKDIQQ